MNLYRQTCPTCSASLTARDCAPMLYRGFGVCKYCCKPFQVKRRTIRIHAAIIGGVIAIMARSMVHASLLECLTYSVLFTLVFQRFIDFFYGLEPADTNLLR